MAAGKATRQQPSSGVEIGESDVSMISVVLVGTNNLFLQGLRGLLDPAQFSVAGEARDVATLQARLDGGLAPDLVVADLNGSQESDLDNLRGIRASYENIRIVVLANELCLAQMARLLKAGIDGYLLNELSAKAFSLSLLLVMTGEKALPSVLASVLADASGSVSSGAVMELPRQTGQVASWCALMKSRGERIPRARCGCISL